MGFGLLEGRPVVVRLPESVLRVFFPPPVTLIDPTGSGVNPADVKAAVIRFPDDELRLERNLERWIATEYGAQATTEIVDSFLDLLMRRRAPVVEIARTFRTDGPSITLYGFGGRPLDTVRVGSHPTRRGLVLENGDSVLRIFEPDVVMPITVADFGIDITASP